MPCSIDFSVTLQTEILSKVTSGFLKQMIILKSFNSVMNVASGQGLYSLFLIELFEDHLVNIK